MRALEHWFELNALRGWNPRAAWLLGLEDSYTGDLYASLRSVYEHSNGAAQGLADWSPSRTASGCYIPASKRAPGVSAGMLGDKVDRLVQLLVGEERGIVVKITDDAQAADSSGKASTSADNPAMDELERVLDEDVALHHLLQLPVLDLIVKGSGVFGFARPEADGPFVGVYLGTEWCDAVFASQVKNGKARAIAHGLAEIPELRRHLGQDSDGWHLIAPKGAKPLDLAFVRYQYRWDEEVAREPNGTATKTIINWIRRDYLPNVIGEYKPVRLEEDQTPPVAFDFIPGASTPHNWGLIPLVWLTPSGTIPGQMDGRSLLTRPVRDMAMAADYALSFLTDSHAFNSAGLLTIINAQIRGVRADMADDGRDFGAADVPTDAGGVLHLDGDNADAKLLESAGAPIDNGIAVLRELESMIQARTGVQEPPADSAKGALSGTAMERLMQRLIGRVNSYRRPVATGVKAFVGKLVQVARLTAAIAGLSETAHATTEWPRIVEQTADDVQAWANAFGLALEKGLLPRDEAVRQFAQRIHYDGDLEELVAAVRADDEAAVAAALKMAQTGPGGANDPGKEPGGDPGGNDPGGNDPNPNG